MRRDLAEQRRNLRLEQLEAQADRDATEHDSAEWHAHQAVKLVAHRRESDIRAEMLEIQTDIDEIEVARKADERRIAMATPGAVMAEIEAVAACAFGGAKTPGD